MLESPATAGARQREERARHWDRGAVKLLDREAGQMGPDQARPGADEYQTSARFGNGSVAPRGRLRHEVHELGSRDFWRRTERLEARPGHVA